jgi:hypothetical protein
MLSPGEVREAVERAARRFVDACVTATDVQWRFHPQGVGDRAWSIPQVVEHVTEANRTALHLLRDVVVSSPRNDRNPDFDDDDMPYLFYGGGGPAPPGLKEPTGLAGKGDSVDAFAASMQAIVDWNDAVAVDLRDCAFVHPAFGLFDGAQWLLFVAVHAQQHRGQILDVKLAADQAASPTT